MKEQLEQLLEKLLNNQSHSLANVERNMTKQEEWLHTVKEIQKFLNGLWQKDVNDLLNTSVGKEGLDMTACSFVIFLDNLKTTKGYIQMKGQAR